MCYNYYMPKYKRFQSLVITIFLCLVYALWLTPLKPVQIASLKIVDTYFGLSSKLIPMPKAGTGVVLVAIDDESLREMNTQWPWPRSVIADTIKKISKGSPAIICADLVFAGKSVDPQEDLILINSLKSAKNVFSAAYFGSDGKYVIPDHMIALNLADFGFVNKPRDADNVIRRMRPYFLSESGNIIDYSLSLKVASRMLDTPAGNLALSLPLSKDGTAYIKFFGTSDKFNYIPAYKIIKESADISLLKNKLVFFGVISESFHDTYNTPLGAMPGLLIDLNETLTYINKNFFRYAANNMNFALIFLFVLIASWGGMRLPILTGAFLSGLLIIASFFLGFFLFLQHIIIDSFGPIFLIAAATAVLHGTRYVVLVVENIALRKEAATDGLTGLYVYRYFELRLKRELKNAFYSRKNLALVIYDIDHFKRINDTYGHEFGNVVLKSIAKNLKNHSRKNNVIARYGGEEFCVIIPGMKRLDAVKYAERLRNLVSSIELKTDKGETVKATMSAGIVMIEDVRENYTDFVKAADEALYRSKNEGRDRISIFDKAACVTFRP